MPETLEHGILYVSKKFELAIHLCACGCGIETVTPFHTTGSESNRGWAWDDSGTLTPSIGNNKFPCRSHYYVTETRIIWLPNFP